MQAVILVGGEGTRMRPLTDTRPKPMLALVDRPIVEHQLDHLRRHGVTDVVFSCGYRPDAIRAHFGDGEHVGMRLRYVVDPEPLGTAGAIKNAEDLIESDQIVVRNGDILTDLDLDAMRRAHHEVGAVGTLALTPVEDPSAFGLVRLFPDRRVEAFLEKPSREELRPGEPYLINAGTYILDRSVLDAIPSGRNVSIERETFPALAGEGSLYGYPYDTHWRDIGNPQAYLAAHADVLGGRIVTDTPVRAPYIGDGAQADGSATIGPLVSLGSGASVGAGALVTDSIIGARARVGEGAVVEGSVLGEGVEVGAGARLARVVAGDGAVFDPGTTSLGTAVATGGRVASTS